MQSEKVVPKKKAKVRFVVRNGRAINADQPVGVVVVDLAEARVCAHCGGHVEDKDMGLGQEFGRRGRWVVRGAS